MAGSNFGLAWVSGIGDGRTFSERLVVLVELSSFDMLLDFTLKEVAELVGVLESNETDG